MRFAVTAFSFILLCGLAGQAGAMELKSTDIAPDATIAKEQVYTRCGGDNVSPQLSWSGAPVGTKSLALTMIDLDVKPAEWPHWIVVGLSPDTTGLSKGISNLPGDAMAVSISDRPAAYAGPCPPVGSGVHHYRFTIWALPSKTVAFSPKTTALDVNTVLSKRAIAQASFTGVLER